MPTPPPIAGREAELLALMQQPRAPREPDQRRQGMRSAFACALHMHQPTIPAGTNGQLISHLQYMLEHPGEGDNHNAEPFAQCYRRMADLMPQLISEGCEPRIMLDYSGTLLWGFEQMGRHDILDALRYLTCDPLMQRHVEWLGSFWGHAVASSTPLADLTLQIQAWQHHFAALFGDEALQQVRGFSLPEMHLPNDPDALHALVAALKRCGYRWLLVQEHSVEQLDGSALSHAQCLVPHRLEARNRAGDMVSITALIKTQGSDTKLVGQMQPFYEALGLSPVRLGAATIPPLVIQIADGENGGVMMNEFPSAFVQSYQRIRDSSGDTAAVNGSEYLDQLEAAGVSEHDFTPIQAAGQHDVWTQEESSTEPTLEGSSWTNSISWVEGYANVLEPMQELSAQFHRRFDPRIASDPTITCSNGYQNALLHLLLLETSCFRYWGQGTWTDYARDLHRRGGALIEQAA
ncbi:MAG: hypothetical protein RLZZ186_1554 [Cyanobacteriota bacterium]